MRESGTVVSTFHYSCNKLHKYYKRVNILVTVIYLRVPVNSSHQLLLFVTVIYLSIPVNSSHQLLLFVTVIYLSVPVNQFMGPDPVLRVPPGSRRVRGQIPPKLVHMCSLTRATIQARSRSSPPGSTGSEAKFHQNWYTCVV